MSCWDRDGHPIDLLTWTRLRRDAGYRRIALTYVGPPDNHRDIRICTLWCGFDKGDPVIPMIFRSSSWQDSTRRFLQHFVADEKTALLYHQAQIDVWSARTVRIYDAATVTHVPNPVSLIRR